MAATSLTTVFQLDHRLLVPLAAFGPQWTRTLTISGSAGSQQWHWSERLWTYGPRAVSVTYRLDSLQPLVKSQ